MRNAEKLFGEMAEELDERELAMIMQRFGICTRQRTLEEIGNSFGVTGKRVRQIEARILKKLRKAFFEQK